MVDLLRRLSSESECLRAGFGAVSGGCYLLRLGLAAVRGGLVMWRVCACVSFF